MGPCFHPQALFSIIRPHHKLAGVGIQLLQLLEILLEDLHAHLKLF